MEIIENKAKYCLLDAARVGPELLECLAKSVSHDSLYRGRSEELLKEVAPYIAELKPGSEFDEWVFSKGWGDNWGVFIKSRDSLETLWKHFRKFLLVRDEKGTEMYFRFYDPRVLRIFLPSCSESQLAEFFGPVDSFIAEDKNPDYLLEFSLQNGKLHTERIALKEDMDNSVPFEPPDVENGMESVNFDTIV